MELSQEVIEQIKAEAEKQRETSGCESDFCKTIREVSWIESATWALISQLPSLCGWVAKIDFDTQCFLFDKGREQIASLQSQLSLKEKEIEEYKKDLIECAGELLIEIPEPHTDLAKVMYVNRMLKYQIESLQEENKKLRASINDENARGKFWLRAKDKLESENRNLRQVIDDQAYREAALKLRIEELENALKDCVKEWDKRNRTA